MASAQVAPGRTAIPKATKAFRPSPVASASGKLATSPMMMLMTPATSAVAAATLARSGVVPPPRNSPEPSCTVPMISGFSTTM